MGTYFDFFMKRPDLVQHLPRELQQLLLEAVREMRRGGSAVPQSFYDTCAAAVPTDLIQSIVADNRKGVSEPSGWLPPEKRQVPEEGKAAVRSSGWSPLDPISSPPGLKYIDQMIDVQDAIDKRELEGKLKRRI
jgi:hypothetical protein